MHGRRTLHSSKAVLVQTSRRHGGWIVALCFAPIAGWVLIAIALALLQPAGLPRQMPPGEGLAWQGLAGTLLVTAWVVRHVFRTTTDTAERKVLAGLALVGGLMAWPIVTLGPLPSLNGARLSDTRTTPMQLARLSTSPQKRSREPFHWAHLQPQPGDTTLRGGRYFIAGEDFEAWAARRPGTLHITHHRGLLGARVLTDITD